VKRVGLALVLAMAAVAALAPATAAAQDQAAPPAAPAALPSRQANFAWDHTLLRASFSYRDVLDAPLVQKLSSGLPTTITMWAYVLREGENNPIDLALRSCRVVYDLWDEVYRVTISSRGAVRDLAVVNVEGVLRQCAEARDLPVVEKNLLRAGAPHFLAVDVEVNPVSQEMLDHMKRWVSRPTGATGIGPSDALFGSFVGLFVRSVSKSDRALRFRTQSFTP